jgi:hypothetical protein
MSIRSSESGPAARPTGGGYARPPRTVEFSAPSRATDSNEFRFRPRERRRPSRMAMGVGLAVLLAVAALVVAVVSLVTQPAPVPTASAPPTGQAIADADKALCQAIGPLMKENDDRSNAFLATGEAGSPERDAALPKFVSDTQGWAHRTQQALDGHATPPRLVTRALQRYVDDMQLFVASVRPGPGTQYDEAAWTDSIVAYGGVLTTCQQVGISW